MSIADELRDYAYHRVDVTRDPLLAIADRIDAAHRSALEKLAAQVDESGALPMTDENMAEHGWVRLPVDADGVPIHVGDWVYVGDKKCKVEAIASNAVYWWEYDGCHWVQAFMVSHHAPTVEDVLREMLSKYDELRLGPSAFDPFELMAEYAAKLRLAGEDA